MKAAALMPKVILTKAQLHNAEMCYAFRHAYDVYGSKPGTADDLLAFLRQDRDWISINNAYDEAGGTSQWQVSAANVTGDNYNEPLFETDIVEATGSTLLEALEAAVRAVAGGVEERDPSVIESPPTTTQP